MPRTLTADLFISVDGYAKGEHSPGYFGYFGPDLDRWINTELSKPQHVLMGRNTYTALAELPEQHRDASYHRMATLPTTVFSTTLTSALWPHTSIEHHDVVGHVRELKRTDGPPLRTMGSLSVVKQLLNAGLVDHLRLMTFPVLVGPDGREPAFEAVAEAELALDGHEVLDKRILLATYAPTGAVVPRLD